MPQLLLQKRKISPATEREILESNTRYPSPLTKLCPGASCDPPKTILDTELALGRKYTVPLAFNSIFSRVESEMTAE